MSIGSKLLSGFSVVIALGVIVVLVAMTRARQVGEEYSRVTGETLPVIEVLGELRFAALRVVSSTSELGFLRTLGKDPGQAEGDRAEAREAALVQNAETLYREKLAAYETLIDRFFPEEEGFKNSILERSGILFSHNDDLADLLARRAPADELFEAKERLEAAEAGLLAAIDDAMKHENAELRERNQAVTDAIDLTFVLLSVVGAFAFCIAALVSYLVSRVISAPIRTLMAATARVAAGNFAPLDLVPRRDEIGKLIGSFQRMTADLAETNAQRRRAEDALKELNQELEQRVEARTAELRSAQEELVRKERLATLGQLTGTVSHELRNPLGAIRSAIEAIKKIASDDKPQLTRAIALVDRSQTRCDKIIGELLDFTRVRELKREMTAVDPWLEELLQEVPLTPGITLERQLGSGAEVALDRDRMHRVVRNVIDNACHAMEDGEDGPPDKDHHLTVATRLAGDRLELAVADSGSGITPEDMGKIFEPLFSTKSFGVGLGLPMVKQIVEQHGGVVEIKSEAGRGTQVTL